MRKWSIFHAELHQRTRLGSFLAAFLFIFIAGSFFAPEKAHADFRVCNATQNLVGVAHRLPGQGRLGHRRLVARQCFLLQNACGRTADFALLLSLRRRRRRVAGAGMARSTCASPKTNSRLPVSMTVSRAVSSAPDSRNTIPASRRAGWSSLRKKIPPASPIVTDTPAP